MTKILHTAVIALGLAMPAAAFAQSVGGTGAGMNSNAGSMSGANIHVDNGINANGTPKQQSPGVSMTNGPNTGGAATLNGDGNATPGGPASTTGMGGSSGGSGAASGGDNTGK